MSDETPPVRQVTETNVLLGRLEAKVDNLTDEQRITRGESAAIRTELSELKADVAVLKSERIPRTTGWSKAAVFAAIPASLGSTVALVLVLTD
jgi:hypothetical protein